MKRPPRPARRVDAVFETNAGMVAVTRYVLDSNNRSGVIGTRMSPVRTAAVRVVEPFGEKVPRENLGYVRGSGKKHAAWTLHLGIGEFRTQYVVLKGLRVEVVRAPKRDGEKSRRRIWVVTADYDSVSQLTRQLARCRKELLKGAPQVRLPLFDVAWPLPRKDAQKVVGLFEVGLTRLRLLIATIAVHDMADAL